MKIVALRKPCGGCTEHLNRKDRYHLLNVEDGRPISRTYGIENVLVIGCLESVLVTTRKTFGLLCRVVLEHTEFLEHIDLDRSTDSQSTEVLYQKMNDA